jgi:tetratricopeptide (TPR) repeat protein
MRRRTFVLPFLAAVALVVLARPLRADDLPGTNGTAGFNVNDVALAEGALPKESGLKAVDAPGEEAKTIDGFLKATAQAKGSSADTIARGFVTADGKPVTVVLADTFGEGDGVFAAVQEGAAKKGWSVRAVGHPTRIVVVAGPEGEREKVLDLQSAFAVKLLGLKLKTQLDSTEGNARDGTAALANSLLRLEPKHALANVGAGIAYATAGAREQDASLTAKAAGFYKAAFAADAVSPLTGDWLLRAKGWYGDAVLNAADGKPSKEARDLLAEVVKALPGEKIQPQAAIGWRYNLACAHARLGEKDAAFEQLGAALEANVKTPVRGIAHWRDKDPDLNPLKDDPRWAKLVEKYPPKKGEGEGEGGEGGMDDGGN